MRSNSPLTVPSLRRLIGAYTVNSLGDWLGQLALSVVILQKSGGAMAVSALWIFGRLIPSLLAPPLLSRLERHGDRLLLCGSHSLEAVVFGCLAFAVAMGLPLGLVLALAALDGLLAVSARSVTKASVVRAARQHGCHEEANALLGVAFTVTFAAGPALAGLLVAVLGAPTVLALDGISFALAAIILAGVGNLRGEERQAPARQVAFRQTLRELNAIGRTRTLLAVDGVASVLFALIIPVEIVFVTRDLGGTPAAFGGVLAAWGLGAVVGSSLLLRLKQVSGGALLCLSYALMASGYLGMGMSHTLTLVVVFSFLGGIGNGLEGATMLTAIQAEVPDRLQGCLNGVLECLHGVLPGVGFLIGGILTSLASPRSVYYAAGAGGLVVLLVAARTLLGHSVRPATARDLVPA
jgi:MFS family permease